MARQRAAELALSDEELIVAREELNALHDELFVLGCAVADTKRDLAEGLEPGDALAALHWLLEAAQPLASRRLGASSPDHRGASS